MAAVLTKMAQGRLSLVVSVLVVAFFAGASPAHAISVQGWSPAPRAGLSFQGRAARDQARQNQAAFLSADGGEHLLDNVKEFLMGAISGAVSSLAVFPIDLAKTRIQDQKVVAGVQKVYTNMFQTIAKVSKDEGLLALYSGSAPVMVGSAPEAALQLGGNNFGRNFFSDYLNVDDHKLPLWAEMLSGGLGGTCQVLASNPMERVKIIQQINPKAGSVLKIAKDIGIGGLYQGSFACFARDFWFGVIYFTTYSRTKEFLLTLGTKKKGERRTETVADLLIAGLVAGVPGAGLTTPMDVIKTRMQASGTGTWAGTANALWKEGGVKALYTGVVPRVGRVAPQLAICLALYESLVVLFPTKKQTAKKEKSAARNAVNTKKK